MNSIRSLVCAGLALAAMALCISMPAAAAVPIDPGVYLTTNSTADYPAPAVTFQDEDRSAVTSEAPALAASRSDGRSSVAPSSLTFASTPVAVDAYMLIDPDIRG